MVLCSLAGVFGVLGPTIAEEFTVLWAKTRCFAVEGTAAAEHSGHFDLTSLTIRVECSGPGAER